MIYLYLYQIFVNIRKKYGSGTLKKSIINY
ncbi:hypothetical protein AVP43_00742 [Geobacillus stearothermophilus]|nr:hypothetical protein AVP43_00742 [Geobacillus stearothermophilus]